LSLTPSSPLTTQIPDKAFPGLDVS